MRNHRVTPIYTCIAALFLLLAVTPPALAGRIAPVLATQLQAAAPGQLHPVIVRLTDQVDHGALRASMAHERKPERVRRTVQALRDKAALTQGEIKKLLDRREQEGKVKGVKSFWIFNGFSLKATAPSGPARCSAGPMPPTTIMATAGSISSRP